MSRPEAPMSLADEEAALKRGKGPLVFVVAGLGVALLVGLFLLLSGDDEARVYGDLGKKINGLRQANFDPFVGCLLPQVNVADLKRADDLIAQLDSRASDGRAAYALHLRDKCVDKLRDVEPELGTLILPDDLKPDVERMREATSKLRSSTSGLVSYLDDPELKYDSDIAKIYLEAIARGWYDWKSAHASINKLLKTKLEAH
jgi:hypothetical protein